VYIPNQDFYEEAPQVQQLVFDEALQKCEFCSKKWNKPNSLNSWFIEFRGWVDRLSCEYAQEGIDPFRKTMNYDAFKSCL